MAPRTRRSPRRKPPRRSRPRLNLLPVGLILIAVWLVLAWGRSTVLPKLVTVGLAEERAFELTSTHRALVVRQESVIHSGAEGTLRILVDDGELVPAGTLIARVANEQEHGRVQAELERVEQDLDAARQRTDEFRAEAERTAAALQADFAAAAAEWASAVQFRCLDTQANLAAVMSDLDKDIRALAARVRQERDTVLSLASRQEGLAAALDRVVTPVSAPQTGAVCWVLDGLEGTVTADWLDGRTPDDVLRLEPHTAVTIDGSEVVAGQPVARLVDTYRFILAVTASVDQVESWPTGGKLIIRIGGREMTASCLGPVGGSRAGQRLVRLELDRDVPELLRDRFVGLEIVQLKTHGVVVPARAVVPRGGQSGVFSVDRSVVRFVPVVVVATADGESLVSGLAAGSRVVFKPGLVWEGMTLP